MLLGTAAGTTFRANNWYGGTPGAAAGAGDVIADPRLVNAGGRSAADYKLNESSPDLRSGLDLAAITSDYFGTPRVGLFDIGAHQYSGAITPLPDTEAPTAPGGFQVTPSVSSTRLDLSWSASTDNVGVTGYKVQRNGAPVATVTGTTWSDTSALAWGTTYQYTVTALDAAGNESVPSTATGTTIADPGPTPPPAGDTTAPTTPSGFSATPSTTTTNVTLTWNASTDNVGVAGYRLYREGMLVATVTGTTWTDNGNLRRNTRYTWAIEAFDAAGNVSGRATVSERTKK
jgi:chitodextrinase